MAGVIGDPEGFVGRIADPDRAALLERGGRRQFPAGAALAHERQVPERVLVLLEGRVKVSASGDGGREAVLAICGPGQLIGELSALDGRPYSATVTALDPVTALALSTGEFRAYLLERPQAALVLLTMLAGSLRDADAEHVEFTTVPTVGRVAARILEIADRYGEPDDDGRVEIDLPLTQEELAGWTGASREAVTRALQSLRACHWIETGRRRLVVLDPEALRRLTG